jgi:cell division protein FtsL
VREAQQEKATVWPVLICAALVLASALAVIYNTYTTRLKYAELQTLRREGYRLEEDWERLLLERSTWANPDRVRQVAQQQLKMVPVSLPDIQVVPRD